jgi:hypothetical protein
MLPEADAVGAISWAHISHQHAGIRAIQGHVFEDAAVECSVTERRRCRTKGGLGSHVCQAEDMPVHF